MNNIYYIFGSPSSLDLDVLVLVKTMPALEEAKKLCNTFNQELSSISSKTINTNIGIVQEGKIVSIFKGTVDEVNNSIIDTYQFHQQSHPLVITSRLPRDKEAKVLRSLRGILSFLSRSQYRVMIKETLKNDVHHKINTLESIDFNILINCQKYPIVDIYKTIAFQMGQCQALLDDVELYTKESIAEKYPLLKDFLSRNTTPDLSQLEQAKMEFIKKLKTFVPNMTKLTEDKWSN